MPDPPAPPRGTRAADTAVFAACLALAVGAGASARADDASDVPIELPIVRAEPVRVMEGDHGFTPARVTLRLSAPLETPLTLDYATEDRSARAGEDYVAQSGQVTFDPGALEESIEIPVVGDTLLEPNESFVVRLHAVNGIALAESAIVCRISNDERTTFEVAEDLYFPPYYSGTICTAWGDFDGDGDADQAMYANGTPTGFYEIPGFRSAVEAGNYHGVAWCDYDRDGDADVVLLPYDMNFGVEEPVGIGFPFGPPRLKLLRNDGGEFTDVAPLLGMDLGGNGETAVWADFDADGWPDLFAPFYSHIPPFQSYLFRNRGNGAFESIGEAAGVHLPGLSLDFRPEGAQAVDVNGDGALDLYVASHLFVNDGTGRFTDHRAAAGLPLVFDEGAFFFDMDDDGDFDLFLRTYDGPRVFRNDGATFVETTKESGLASNHLAWGDNRADVDNDGDVDLVLAGHDGSPRLFLNRGDGTFAEDASIAGLDPILNMCAFADLDGDGDLDLSYDGVFGRRVLRNRLENVAGAWGASLRVRVLDVAGRESAFGATVRLRGPHADVDGVQTRSVDGGSGYLTQNDYVVHFGGVGPGPVALEVVYPSGAGQRFVVDQAMNPDLGAIEVGEEFAPRWRLFQDGRFEPEQRSVTGAGGADAAAAHAVARIERVTPTPARVSTSFELTLPRAARVELAIHDVRGRRVRRIDAGELPAGGSRVAWDLRDGGGRSVSSGVYVCRLVVDGQALDGRRVPVVR